MRISRGIATLSIAALTLVGASACSSDEPEDETSTTAEESEAPEPEPTEEETEETEESDAGAGDGTAAAWANPVTTPGTLLTTMTSDQFTVDIYQVGVTQATKTGQFADPDGNPIIAEGSDIVFVNYVVTNTGGPVPLGASLVSLSARYADWPYMQGMDSVVDNDLFAAQQVNSSATAPGSYVDPYVLAWEPGAQFSFGQNFRYQASSPITFTATMTPVDDQGDLVHEKKIEVTADTTIA